MIPQHIRYILFFCLVCLARISRKRYPLLCVFKSEKSVPLSRGHLVGAQFQFYFICLYFCGLLLYAHMVFVPARADSSVYLRSICLGLGLYAK